MSQATRTLSAGELHADVTSSNPVEFNGRLFRKAREWGGFIALSGVIEAIFFTVVLVIVTHGFTVSTDPGIYKGFYGYFGGTIALGLILFAVGTCKKHSLPKIADTPENLIEYGDESHL